MKTIRSCYFIGFFCFIAPPVFASMEIIKNAKMIQYSDGEEEHSAYLSLPDGAGPFPAVLLIHDEHGLDAWIKNTADTLSQKGYAALAVDLTGIESRDPSASTGSRRTEQMLEILRGALQYLRKQETILPEKIGCIGWRQGGSDALQTAIHLQDLTAAVMCYGEFIQDPETLQSIHCPVLVVDPSHREEAATDFATAMLSVEKQIQVQLYDYTEIGFMREGEHFDPAAASHAWGQIHRFLQQHLKDNP